MVGGVYAGRRPADAHPQAGEVPTSQALNDRGYAQVPARAAARPQTNGPQRYVQIVVDDQETREGYTIVAHQRPHWRPAEIHEIEGFGQDHIGSGDGAPCYTGLVLEAVEGEAVCLGQAVQALEAYVVAMARILGSGVAQADDEVIVGTVRSGGFSRPPVQPGEEAHDGSRQQVAHQG